MQGAESTVRTAAERRGNTSKCVKDVYLQAEARIGPCLFYACHIRSTKVNKNKEFLGVTFHGIQPSTVQGSRTVPGEIQAIKRPAGLCRWRWG